MTLHRLEPGLTSAERRTLSSPNDGAPIAEIEHADPEGAEEALRRIVAAAPAVAAWPAYRRAEALRSVATAIRASAEAFAQLIALEGGKPLRDARIEVERAATTTAVAADEALRLAGEQLPMDGSAAGAGRLAFTIREPIGPVLAISAFNHPLNLIAHQVAPALAAGCPVLVKPASTTPLSCLRYVELLRATAGVPADAVLAVPMSGATAERIATDRRVRFVSFIGSAAVGWHLRRVIAPGTRLALEHGGAAPVILAADADLDDALPRLVKGGFYHAGQVCVSVQRIYVDDSMARGVAERLAQLAGQLVVGDARAETTDVGPIITPAERDRVAEWVAESGAERLCGGEPTGHQHYAPTVTFAPPDTSKLIQHEVFGPVVSVLPYHTLDEAITRANAVPFSFQASIFTRDLERALHAAKKLEASAVMINDHTAFRVDWMPFGGRRESGLGLGGVRYALQELTEPKLIVFR